MLDVPLQVEPEGYEEVENKRRTEGDKGNVDEIKPDPRGGDSHLFA